MILPRVYTYKIYIYTYKIYCTTKYSLQVTYGTPSKEINKSEGPSGCIYRIGCDKRLNNSHELEFDQSSSEIICTPVDKVVWRSQNHNELPGTFCIGLDYEGIICIIFCFVLSLQDFIFSVKYILVSDSLI